MGTRVTHTVEVERTTTPSINMFEMQPGDIGEVTDTYGSGAYMGRVVMCAYDGQVITLKDPYLSWRITDRAPSLKVTLFPEGTKVTLKVGRRI